MRYLALLLLVLVTNFAYAGIYKWTDQDGNVHFSDKPEQGAEEVRLPKTQEYSSPEISGQVNNVQEAAAASSGYTSVTILQPSNDFTVRNNHGSLAVMVNVEPELAKSHTLQLYLDSQKVGKPQGSTAFTLKGVDRGTHKLSVAVFSGEGAELIKSDEVTVHMHRPRTNQIKKIKQGN